MKATFFHDSKFKYDEEGIYYTTGGLTRQFLMKYIEYVEQLVIVTRKEKLQEKDRKKCSIASCNNVKFECFENLSLIKLLLGKYNFIIKQRVIESDFCIIRLHSFIGYIACHYAEKLGKPYLIELVGCPFDALWNYGNIHGKIMAPICYLLTRHYVRQAPNVLYVTNEFLQKRYPNKNNNIGCSDVNLEYIKEEVLNKRIDKILNYKSSSVYKLGLIGSLNVNFKGHVTAIEAISKMKELKNVELHFLGAGDKEKWIKLAKKYHVEDKVFFDGTLPGGEPVYEWMDSLDLYLIPSLQEGMPRALIEAMSRGCPVIGAKTGGIPELIGNTNIFGRKNSTKLCNLIEKSLKNHEQLIKMAKTNFYKSKEFESKKLDDTRRKFYRNAIFKSGGR